MNKNKIEKITNHFISKEKKMGENDVNIALHQYDLRRRIHRNNPKPTGKASWL